MNNMKSKILQESNGNESKTISQTETERMRDREREKGAGGWGIGDNLNPIRVALCLFILVGLTILGRSLW